ncbi:hypothetical protein GGR57DRAFT_148239 [Xylariaceae sp. FL1272]|nr:hypothetical protein GGR57DRAFT_148239 [Xylariaceae sp. FL1272]
MPRLRQIWLGAFAALKHSQGILTTFTPNFDYLFGIRVTSNQRQESDSIIVEESSGNRGGDTLRLSYPSYSIGCFFFPQFSSAKANHSSGKQ